MLDWLFGKKEKTYPILTSEMLQPTDNKIGTTEAKRIYKDWMLKIGYLSNKDKLDKMELTDMVSGFADEMKSEEESLKEEAADEIRQVKDAVADLKEELKALKQELKGCKDPAARAALESDIADLQQEIATPDDGHAIKAITAYEAFKADKRAFLIEAVNRQVHGSDWRQKPKL